MMMLLAKQLLFLFIISNSINVAIFVSKTFNVIIARF